MAHENISISEILDDSSVKKEKRKFVSRSITMRGDGNGIWNTLKSEMEDSKKLVKNWDLEKDNDQLKNKIYESEEEDEELSHS